MKPELLSLGISTARVRIYEEAETDDGLGEYVPVILTLTREDALATMKRWED